MNKRMPTKQEILEAIEAVLKDRKNNEENAVFLYENIFGPLYKGRAYYRAMNWALTCCIVCLLAVYPQPQNPRPHHVLEQAVTFAAKALMNAIPTIKADIEQVSIRRAKEKEKIVKASMQTE